MIRNLFSPQKATISSLLQIADQHRDLKNWAQAAAAYEEFLRVQDGRSDIWVQLGHALKEASRLDDAEAAYRRAILLDPKSSDAFLHLGHALKVKGKFSEAIEAYVSSARLDPNNEHALFELRSSGWSSFDIADVISNSVASGEINSQASYARRVTRLVLSSSLMFDEFDYQAYESTFEDVQALVKLGVLSSARQHYVHYGYRQGRDVLMSLSVNPPTTIFVLCPSFFKRCGIGEHARYLADCIEASGYPVNRIRSTRELSSYTTDDLKNSALIVNHGPGLFDGYNPELSEGETTSDLIATLLHYFKNYRVRPIVFMHSLLDRDNEVMFPRQQMLLEAPIPVVTTIEAASKIFNIFRVEHGMQPLPTNATLIPQNSTKRRDTPTIGFFGFFQWGGKNFDALFNIAQSLKAKLVGSIATRDQAQVDKIRSMLVERNVSCDIGTGWVEDYELARRLSEADFHYLPQHDYDHWNNSGTARFVMNFGKPVIVPPHNPFLDLRDFAIFAEEHDLPAVISWLRDGDTYDQACGRTLDYMTAHPMSAEMPLLASQLHMVASKQGAGVFLDQNVFCLMRLLYAPAEGFSARVERMTGTQIEGLSLVSSPTERLRALRKELSERAKSELCLYPAVEPIQYWRDHYEINEFFGYDTADTVFVCYRRMLKREPTLSEFRTDRNFLISAQNDKANVSAKAVVTLLGRLGRRRNTLPFAPDVQIYVNGHPLEPADLLADHSRMTEIERGHLEILHLVSEFSVARIPHWVPSEDTNLFSILFLPPQARMQALKAVCRMADLAEFDFAPASSSSAALSTFHEVILHLSRIGVRPTDVFLMDEPMPPPISTARTSYHVGEFWPYDGDSFIINAVRCLMKREPTTHDMFELARELDMNGKLAVIELLLRRPTRNAGLCESVDASQTMILDAIKEELQILIRQFRSPIAGGWQMRNTYLETKRNLSRQWLHLKQQKDIWWEQSGHNVSAIITELKS